MLSLDHIVFAGRDIEETSNKYSKDYALKTIKGGQHENWGTYNYLAHFSNNCYIEWLGINDVTKVEQSRNPLIKHLVHVLTKEKQGPFQFALRTNNIDKFVAHFNRENILYFGPIKGERRKPDGSLLTWRMLFPTYDANEEVLPFLIEWDQPFEERVDTSIMNGPAITSIYYGGMTIDRFVSIYNLPKKKRRLNKVQLRNSKIVFTEEKGVSIDLR